MKAIVTVMLKTGVLDPQGKAIGHALGTLGFSGIGEVRAGKVIEIELAETDAAKAQAAAEEMSWKLLANTVIESFKVETRLTMAFRAGIVLFPGTNRERDIAIALAAANGGREPVIIWHKDTTLPPLDLVVLPGGFSHGDYLRCGAIRGPAQSPVMRAVRDFASAGPENPKTRSHMREIN